MAPRGGRGLAWTKPRPRLVTSSENITRPETPSLPAVGTSTATALLPSEANAGCGAAAEARSGAAAARAAALSAWTGARTGWNWIGYRGQRRRRRVMVSGAGRK